MDEQPQVVVTEKTDAARPVWQKPELVEVAISDVTASIYATSGNDGTFGYSNVS